MQWNDHSRLVGQHAFLGASKYHWLNYDTQRLVDAFMSCQAKEKGTRLHAFAAECINLKQKLPKSKKTLNAYVNDAIGFRMTPSRFCFTAKTVLVLQMPLHLTTKIIFFVFMILKQELFQHI